MSDKYKKSLSQIRKEITNHPSNSDLKKLGYNPIYTAGADVKIVIIGQAPGIKAQESEIPWDDKSGEELIKWLGIDFATFRDPRKVSLLPMDFYYPGKGKTGDLPPRKDFAIMWHNQILSQMPNIKISILIGKYAQDYYLKDIAEKNLTETVKNYKNYLPEFFPIVHPSPLNFRWHTKNPWFKESVVPELKETVRGILDL